MAVIPSAWLWAGLALGGATCGVEFRELAGVWFAPKDLVRLLPDLEGVGFHASILRLECSAEGRHIRLSSALEGRSFWATTPFPLFETVSGSEPLRWAWLPNPQRDTVGHIALEGELLRGEAMVQGSFFELGVGRMPVHPGVSRVAGVLDVVTPRPPTTLDPGQEPTADFVRLWFFRNALGGGVLIHDDSSWLGLVRMDQGLTTLGWLGGMLQGEAFLGAYGERLEDPFILWVEGRWHPERDARDRRREWAVEMGLACLSGSHEVSLAIVRYADLSPSARNRLMARGFRWFGGGAYAFAKMSWSFQTLNRLEGLAILNLEDRSALLQAFLYRDLSDRQDVALWLFRGWGSLNQEFGPLGWGIGLYWRYVE